MSVTTNWDLFLVPHLVYADGLQMLPQKSLEDENNSQRGKKQGPLQWVLRHLKCSWVHGHSGWSPWAAWSYLHLMVKKKRAGLKSIEPDLNIGTHFFPNRFLTSWMEFWNKTFQGNSQYHRVLLGTAIAIQSNGTLLFLESTQVRTLRQNGIWWCAPPCSTWVWLSRATTGRSLTRVRGLAYIWNGFELQQQFAVSSFTH